MRAARALMIALLAAAPAHARTQEPPKPITDRTVTDIMTPRRHNDDSTDVWSVYNRLQEGLIRGGVRVGPLGGVYVVDTSPPLDNPWSNGFSSGFGNGP